MKTFGVISSVFLFVCIVSACYKTNENVDIQYDTYLKVALSASHHTITDTVCIIAITNTLDKEFEKECVLQYSLINRSTNAAFGANENLINKHISNKPSFGYLNLQGGGNYNYVINLNNLHWDNGDFKSQQNAEYDLKVSLFIKDADAPNNVVSSNVLRIKK